MSRNQKIVLFIASLALLSCCACGIVTFVVLPRIFENTIAGATDPAKAKEVGKQIADYTLPSGYEEKFGMDIFTTKMVMIAPSQEQRGGLFIMLMQVAADTASREQMEQQMRQSFQQGTQRNMQDMRVVGAETVTIKGQPVTLTISEGTADNSAVTMRQAVGAFQGKGGAALIMVMGAVSDWDKTLLDNFYKSMR
jgi:hypothetical protein